MALEPMMPSDDDANPELEDFSRRFWWTLPLSVIVLALAMLGHRIDAIDADTRTWVEFALSTPVVLWAGWPFFVRCAQSMRTGNLNMWTLIGIGVGAAYGLQRGRDPGTWRLSCILSTSTVAWVSTSRPPRSSSR